MENFHIDEDIKKAETLPATFYRSDEVFELLKERVFKSSYQWFGSLDDLAASGILCQTPFVC